MAVVGRFEAWIDMGAGTAGVCLVSGHLGGYEVENLRESAMCGARALTVRLFDIRDEDLEAERRRLGRTFATLAQRGVCVNVIAA